MTTGTISGIHHVNLTVTDLVRSSEWYQRVLELAPGWGMEDVEGRGQKVILLVPDSPLRLVLTRHETNDGMRASEFQTGLDHLAFTVETREELEGWVTKLDHLGVEHSAVKEGATGWLITLRDPDNIQLELYTNSK